MKNLLKIINIVATMSVLVVIFADLSFAATNPPADTHGTAVNPPLESKTFTLNNPIKVDSVGAAVNEGAKIFSYIAVLVGVLMLIWIGLQFILAKGKPDRLKELKSHLLMIVVGIAIVIGARIIIQVVVNTLDATKLVDQQIIRGAHEAIGGQ